MPHCKGKVLHHPWNKALLVVMGSQQGPQTPKGIGLFLPGSTAEQYRTRALCCPWGRPQCCRGSSSCFCSGQSWSSARAELRGWRRRSCWSLSPREHSWPPLQNQERGGAGEKWADSSQPFTLCPHWVYWREKTTEEHRKHVPWVTGTHTALGSWWVVIHRQWRDAAGEGIGISSLISSTGSSRQADQCDSCPPWVSKGPGCILAPTAFMCCKDCSGSLL